MPADDEQGDVCGTVTAAAKNRMLAVSTDLSNANVEGAGRHEIARYQPGAAAGAAAAMIGLLAHCTKIKQDFDGQPAEVSATAIGPNIATFSLKFGSGAVNYGALAITAAGDYLSVSATYAGNAKAAGSLAGKLDAAARKKLTARGL